MESGYNGASENEMKAQSRGEADGEWGKLKVDARKGGRKDMAEIQIEAQALIITSYKESAALSMLTLFTFQCKFSQFTDCN